MPRLLGVTPPKQAETRGGVGKKAESFESVGGEARSDSRVRKQHGKRSTTEIQLQDG